ncbi:MAG: hypothetical protein A2Y62_22070 [Candidatus Fischerbacteria bacterium RBG_13_37_8]|uniref:Transposase IS200-like domain-containing protein n=1 Tax=Candidatus Fischerbacteria bacterium RBG_13_37_8 TaxID=1817863 RepID=A0A1F5VY61_9BACT|nr:MAG: hypothetical protein A2Y62_22070 [Candidatus Fischerbacteria bacterium RBG_13_37_8]
MAKSPRLQYEDALYHVHARGNERKPIYRNKDDYLKFLSLLSELPARFQVIIHGYVLMRNHFHLLIETPAANIGQAMHYLNGAFAWYFNRKYWRVGHLFQARYSSHLIEKESYLYMASRYIHRNPLRKNICKHLQAYPWSSYGQYIGLTPKEHWLTTEWILGQFSDYESQARILYKDFVEDGIDSDTESQEYEKFIFSKETIADAMNEKIFRPKDLKIPDDDIPRISLEPDQVIQAVQKIFDGGASLHEKYSYNNPSRRICIYLLRRYSRMSNKEIGHFFSIRKSAVSMSKKRMEIEINKNNYMKELINKIILELGISIK